MSLMKPIRKRKKGAGNSAPPKRQPFPEVSQGLLDEKLQAYCRNMGIKEAMNFHEYKNLQAQQAENVRALVRLSRLLASLLFVPPEAKIKYCNLKQSLVVLQQDWGHELLSAHWPKTDHSFLPGKAADVIGVVLHHWRRVSKTEASWKRFCFKLDETEVDSMEALRKRMARNPDKHGPAAKTGRQLKAHVSDVTVDSDGYPKMLEEEVASSDGEVASTSDGETFEGEGTAKETPPQNLDQSALKESPPPCLKKKWREVACKRPAATQMEPKLSKKPASHQSLAKGLGKKKKGKKDQEEGTQSLAKGLGKKKKDQKDKEKGTAKVPIHKDSVKVGGGKNQAYIQHVPGPGSNKRLIVAITKSQTSQTSKTHKELVELLLPACQKEGACKEDVLKERAKLLSKHAK